MMLVVASRGGRRAASPVLEPARPARRPAGADPHRPRARPGRHVRPGGAEVLPLAGQGRRPGPGVRAALRHRRRYDGRHRAAGAPAGRRRAHAPSCRCPATGSAGRTAGSRPPSYGSPVPGSPSPACTCRCPSPSASTTYAGRWPCCGPAAPSTLFAAGDLNERPGHAAWSYLEDEGHARPRAGSGPTFPAAGPDRAHRRRVRHRRVEVVDYQVVDRPGGERASDHRPVLVTVRVPSA